MSSTQPEVLSFSPMSEVALAEFSDVRTFVSRVVSDLVAGSTLTHSAADLQVLQALVAHEALKHANYEAWVAVGIAFGDCLAAYIPGLAWCLATDQNGTNAALRFRNKTLAIFAPTMLWKRVERGEEVDLLHIADELKGFMEEHAHEYRDA